MYINIVPGPVCKLSYEEDTDTSVNITWKPPKETNGDIVAYFVEHEVYQNELTTSVRVLLVDQCILSSEVGKLLPFTHMYTSTVYLCRTCISKCVCQPQLLSATIK